MKSKNLFVLILFITTLLIIIILASIRTQSKIILHADRELIPQSDVCPPFNLYDEDGNIIDPVNRINAEKPYSPKQTCGKCHDYDKITLGYHFQQGKDEVATSASLDRYQWVSTPGNYGGTWCSPAPLYRHLSPKKNNSARTIDMTSFSFITAGCGDCHPGGGPAEYDRSGFRYDNYMVEKGYKPGGLNDLDGDYYHARWSETGVLEADCMICHQPGYNNEVRKQQLKLLNFRWAPTAASGWGVIKGSVDKNMDVKVSYDLSVFDADGKISPHIVREPRNEACLFCHAQPGWKKRGANFDARTDVHIRAGMKCVDCHPAGSKALDERINEREMHQFAKGDDPGGRVRDDLDNTVLDCNYCHTNGYLGAPIAKHNWLPPLHLEQIACQTCHIPERLVKPAQFQASDVFNPGTKISTKGKHLWVFYGPDMKYYNHYGNLEMMGFDDKPTDPFKPVLVRYKGKIRPANRVHSAWPGIEVEGKPGLMQPKMGDIVKMWEDHFGDPSNYPELSLITDDNDDKVIEVNRPEEINALISAVTSMLKKTNYPMEGRRVVWAMNDRIFTSGTDYYTIKKEEWESSPYANVHTYNHDVYPARAAIGTNGCSDCHDKNSGFYTSMVVSYPFDLNAEQLRIPQSDIMGYKGKPRKYSGAPAHTASFFKWLTIIVLVSLFIHMGLDFLARKRYKKKLKPINQADNSKNETVQRFDTHFLTQHLLLIISVVLLIISGVFEFAARFNSAPWALSITSGAGGLDFWRIIHRLGGALLVFVSLYHIVYIIIYPEGRRNFIALLPRWHDFQQLGQNLKWFLGLKSDPPSFGRFTYFEKFDYWAVFWGVVIMAGTGVAMWFPDITRKLVNSEAFVLFNSFKEAHAHEAILAVTVLLFWHMYNVHFRPGKFPGSLLWINGSITKEEMENDHPEEFESQKQNEKNK